jgi:hypothetical protein
LKKLHGISLDAVIGNLTSTYATLMKDKRNAYLKLILQSLIGSIDVHQLI